MIDYQVDGICPSAQTLIEVEAASRIHAKDDSLYDFSENAQQYARDFMGWTTLASEPPTPIEEIQAYADELIEEGLETVVLIGEGGSTQAPMTMTKYNKVDDARVQFRTLDSVSPVRVRATLASCNPLTTLFVQSSKSGGTIEPALIVDAVQNLLSSRIPEEEMANHFACVSDPGSCLVEKAEKAGWSKVFLGEPNVGGRYSALSVFGLVPAALVGIDLERLLANAREAEALCSTNEASNPAIVLASFLYDNLRKGRDKFSFLSPKRGRVLGLWVEQLVAESVGKEGKGILPSIEVDPLVLSTDPADRSVIIYNTKTDLVDEQENFARSMQYIDEAVPSLTFSVSDVYDLAGHFVMWEYAVAMLGYLMKVCPFDQPDVQVAKTAVLEILEKGRPAPTFTQQGILGIPVGPVEVNVSHNLHSKMWRNSLGEALRVLMHSIRPGDYFSINAFLPFAGEGRREALEDIRHVLSDRHGVTSCLEIGPRYLHSTGQLQKGGPNNGVFLILSATEPRDIPVRDERAKSLGELAQAQALGDFMTLSERGRRVVYVNLPDNSSATLRALAKAIRHRVPVI
jgi:glucose-6-phosphate isomerase